MPLPRFHRLPAERQEQLLAVARTHLAAHGPSGVSLNRIIEEAGISKTSAYLYFDGKDDLVDETLHRLHLRIVEQLGPWAPVDSADAFWDQLAAGSRRLEDHLAADPEAHAIVQQCYPRFRTAVTEPWFEALLENGRQLGIVRTDVDAPLLLGATAAVFRAADVWALDRMAQGAEVPVAQMFLLLRALWAPNRP